MKVIPVIEVSTWDGGDRHNFAFYIDNTNRCGVSHARAYQDKHPHDIVRETEIVIFEGQVDYNEFRSGKVRERALAKLTAEERKALGF